MSEAKAVSCCSQTNQQEEEEAMHGVVRCSTLCCSQTMAASSCGQLDRLQRREPLMRWSDGEAHALSQVGRKVQ